jgi:hypothetical protein
MTLGNERHCLLRFASNFALQSRCLGATSLTVETRLVASSHPQFRPAPGNSTGLSKDQGVHRPCLMSRLAYSILVRLHRQGIFSYNPL